MSECVGLQHVCFKRERKVPNFPFGKTRQTATCGGALKKRTIFAYSFRNEY